MNAHTSNLLLYRFLQLSITIKKTFWYVIKEKKGKRENKKGTHFLRQHACHVLLYVA